MSSTVLLRARSLGRLLTRLCEKQRVPLHGGSPQMTGPRHMSALAAAGWCLQPPTVSLPGVLPMGPHMGLAARLLSTDSTQQPPAQQPQQQQPQQQPQQQQQQQRPKAEEAYDSLELTEEKIHAITDKIPQRPVGVVEGTSYSLIILAAFGVLIFFVYNFVVNFLLEPVEVAAFNATLDRLKHDPRITVRLGGDITGYGADSASRVARHQIPNVVYKDAAGVEHVRIQFHMRGPGGLALVNADMYKDAGGGWQYAFLIADVRSGTQPVQRLNIVAPTAVPSAAATTHPAGLGSAAAAPAADRLRS